MGVAICLQHQGRQPTERNPLRKLGIRGPRGPPIAVFAEFPRLTPHQVSMSDSLSVLILAREELISALLGLLVETTGHSVSFAAPKESSRDAMRRIRPNVVIVDCDHRDCTGDLVKAANEVGAQLILFSASREPEYVRKMAAPSHSQSFTFPIEPPRLDSMIRHRLA